MRPDSLLPAPLCERALPWAKLPATVIRQDSLLSQPPFFCDRALFWAKPKAIRLLKAMHLAQPPLRLFCACDVLPVKVMQRPTHWGEAIEPARCRCCQGRLPQ